MSGKPKAFLMNWYESPYDFTEWWRTEDGSGIYVDFNIDARETVAFPYDLKHGMLMSCDELGVWHKDMTGGRAMQELSYEPVEDDQR